MVERRFLTLAEVAEILSISSSQTYALVRSGDLRAIKVGGRRAYDLARAGVCVVSGLALGIDGVITDAPDVAVRARAELSAAAMVSVRR